MILEILSLVFFANPVTLLIAWKELLGDEFPETVSEEMLDSYIRVSSISDILLLILKWLTAFAWGVTACMYLLSGASSFLLVGSILLTVALSMVYSFDIYIDNCCMILTARRYGPSPSKNE